MSILLVDVGNTRIKWRTIQRQRGFDSLATTDVDRLPEHLARPALPAMRRAIVSCVAGVAAMAALERALRSTWPDIEVHEVVPDIQSCGVINDYAEPSRLGADRWAALIGAHAAWPANPVVVCSFGTATTIDLLMPADAGRARFVGGSILPGIAAMRRVLAATARLTMDAGHAVDFATRTEDAIESGILMAQIGAVGIALDAARQRADAAAIGEPLTCLLAGGDADRVAARIATKNANTQVVPDLVLVGLATCATLAERVASTHVVSV